MSDEDIRHSHEIYVICSQSNRMYSFRYFKNAKIGCKPFYVRHHITATRISFCLTALSHTPWLARPPDIVWYVGGLSFYRDSSVYLSIFLRQLASELVERNSTKAGHLLGSECEFKMHVRNVGYTLP